MVVQDEFLNKYTYDESVESVEFDETQLGQLETYGPDLELAKKIRDERPNNIWSAVDGDDGDILVVAGMHFVNCIYFIVTIEPWESEDEQYVLLSEEPESED